MSKTTPSFRLVSDRLIDEAVGEALFEVTRALRTDRLTVTYTPGVAGTPPTIDGATWTETGADALPFAGDHQALIETQLARRAA